MSPFIETRSGRRFHPLNPQIADIHIEDIAHALSQQCRFSGHTRVHYSVAEHCVRVKELLERWRLPIEVQRWGLLHDASEAYLVDLPSPLKSDPRFAFYGQAEVDLMRAICERFDLSHEMPIEVKDADEVLLATEARDLMAYRPEHWAKLTKAPLKEPIRPWGQEAAKHLFLATFFEVQG